CGSLLEVENKKVLKDQQILVKNDVILALDHDVGAPIDSEQIDLSKQVCMPGLMDTHVHIMIDSTKGNRGLAERTGGIYLCRMGFGSQAACFRR
ncbi:MAG: hypothetical protein RLO18_23535, partial [Gimesia chilikensis]